MFIEIKKVKFKNFMSYIEESEFYISNGVTLINGTNGKGKSTILETIYYGLFGKPFRKISNNDLVNSVTGKNLEVEITFNIQEDTYIIKRGMRPSKFEIYKNDELIVQDAKTLDYQKMLEEKILKTSDSVFKQLVLLGANIPTSKNFSELSNREREEIFQYIIDIGIFAEYTDISKSRLKDLKNELSQSDQKLEQLNTLKIKIKADIERQEEVNKNLEKNKQDKKETLQKEYNEVQENIEKIEKAEDLLGSINEIEIESNNKFISETKTSINEKNLLISSYKQKINLIESLEKSHNNCLGCKELITISGIDVSLKDSHLNIINETLKELERFKIDLETTEAENKILIEKLQKIKLIQTKKNEYINSLKNIQEKIKIIEDIKESIIDYTILNDIIEQEKSLIVYKVRLEKDIIDFISFQDLISDKNLKGKILDMSLPIINKWINYFLEKFGNFPFLFTINTDLSESIITMDGSNIEKAFNALSNGQKLRIVFSILFAFLKFSEDKNTTHFNILFLDEVLDSSLDTEGRLELINILRTEFKDRSINIISHNTEIKEAEEIFEYIYDVTNTENGSKITKTTGEDE